ncbi:MAG TPA: D-glycerate dehydrogenase [Armatimonadetes bacterium]|nr:D-glycerate dehydrogenase [Armatimonadota bacterium]
MAKPKVYVTRLLPGEALSRLEGECEVEVNPEERAPTKEEIIEHVRDKDGLLCLLTDKVDSEVMDSAPNLKVISNYAVGFDNIDVKAATERGIVVTNTPGVLTETTADLAWALLMAVARRIVEADKFTREGKFKGWSPTLLLGSDVYGKTLGIIGFGRIGRAVAKRAKGFEMRVLYYDIERAPEEVERELNAQYVDLEALLKEADYISIHAPLTPETHHMIGERELKMMKPTAYLINTARGPIVDERALVRALKEGWIAGAALDVYENEPELTPGLAELPNVVLAPHIGSASAETRTKMAEMAVSNLLSVLKGERPENIVNPEVWGRRRT